MGLTREVSCSHNRFRGGQSGQHSAVTSSEAMASPRAISLPGVRAIALHNDPRHPAAPASCHRPHYCHYFRLLDGRNGLAYHEFTRNYERQAVVHATRVRATSKRRISSRPSMNGNAAHGPKPTLVTVMRPAPLRQGPFVPSFHPENFCRVILASAWSG